MKLSTSFIKIFIFVCFGLSQKVIADTNPYHFVFQEIYNSNVTLSRITNMFNDLTTIVKQPIKFSGKPDINSLKPLIESDNLDLLIWGHSKKLDHYLKLKGYESLASADIEISLFEYKYGLNREKNQPYKVAVMADSAAHFITSAYLKKTDDLAEIVAFKNYFEMTQAIFRKEIHLIGAAPSFLLPQPNTVQKKFIKVKSIPVTSKVTVWIKSQIPEDMKSSIFQYLTSKETYLSNNAGTGSFIRHKNDPK